MEPIHIESIAHYAQTLRCSPYVIADFYKDNCLSCVMQNKALELLSQRKKFNKFTLAKVPLERVGEAFFKRLGIQQTPTLGFYYQGKQRLLMHGFHSVAEIENNLEEDFLHIRNFKTCPHHPYITMTL